MKPKRPSEAQIRIELKRLDWQLCHPHSTRLQRELVYGAARALEWVLGKEAAKVSPEFRRGIIARLRRLRVAHCAQCGCTIDHACPGGCDWSLQSGFCTRCRPETGGIE
jgi:hypothetical protein